jgi:hypothetical protein
VQYLLRIRHQLFDLSFLSDSHHNPFMLEWKIRASGSIEALLPAMQVRRGSAIVSALILHIHAVRMRKGVVKCAGHSIGTKQRAVTGCYWLHL